MDRSLHDMLTSALFALLAGLALWPPRAVYWEAVAPVLGDTLTLAFVAAVAVGLGAAFARGTRVGTRRFVGGGLVAYAVGMAAIELVLAPNSPVHLILYGGLLACLVGGVVLVRSSVLTNVSSG